MAQREREGGQSGKKEVITHNHVRASERIMRTLSVVGVGAVVAAYHQQ